MKGFRHMERVLAATILVACVLLIGCPPPPPDPIFSFAVIADPHLYGNPDYQARAEAAVQWINDNRVEDDIELVFIVGDVAWGSGKLDVAKTLFDGLEVPYLPLLGDNEIQAGDEAEFDDVFGPHYASMDGVLDNWQRAPTPVWNPERGQDSYFQNFSFDFMGVHFVGLDWCTRVIGGLEGEQADLHDFAGGTWQWFTDDIAAADKSFTENIVMLSHHPMHVAPVLPIEVAAFSVAEDETVENFTGGYADNVYADLAGHYHVDFFETRSLGGYDLYVTEAIHLLDTNLRLVRVYSDGSNMTYHHERIVVP